MPPSKDAPTSIDAYIAAFPPQIQSILESLRATIKKAAPGAEESISYRIPTFKLHGVVAHFAAFKNHIGFYPPVRGDARLQKAVSHYAGEKGNLKFPIDQPIPYGLIEKIVKLKVKQNSPRRPAAANRRQRSRAKK